MKRGSESTRRGFLMAYVVVLGVLVGALVFTYHQSFRHRNVQVRLGTDRATARFLARAAIDLFKFTARELAYQTRPGTAPDLENGTILPFFMNDPESLLTKVKTRTKQGQDHRALVEQLLGRDSLKPLDDLAARYPAAKVELFLDLAVEPFSTQLKALKDTILKTVTVTLKATASVRKAQESYRYKDSFPVYSVLPYGLSKMTFAGLAASPNRERVDVAGNHVDGAVPLVLFHDPADCDPVATNPFKGTTQKPLLNQPVGPDDVIKSNLDRGFVFLTAQAPDQPVVLNLASGGTPFGEYHTVYQPTDSKTTYPQAKKLAQQPEKIDAFRPPDPLDPLVRQAAFIQGAIFGLFMGLDTDLAGPPPPNGNPTMVSQLKPYGTGAYPSPTAMIGLVWRSMAALSDVATDRDDRSNDETDQQACVGRALPQREGIDPFLANCDASAYTADLALEAGSTDPQYRRLLPFGDHGRLTNENLRVDLDGDGQRETLVASETTHNPIRLDLDRWKYANLFKDHSEFSRCMSKWVEFPANLSLRLGGDSVANSTDLLMSAAFGKASNHDDYLLKEPVLEHRDPVHQRLHGKDPKVYIDGRGLPLSDLKTLVEGAPTCRFPMEVTWAVRGQADFEKHFGQGGTIDLQNRSVMVLPEEDPNAPLPLKFGGAVTVRSGGVLRVPRFEAASVVNQAAGDDYTPLVVVANSVKLTGKGPFEAIWVTESITLGSSVKDYAVLKGTLSCSGMPSGFDLPVVVVYDPRNDPTGKEACRFYRLGYATPSAQVYELLDRP